MKFGFRHNSWIAVLHTDTILGEFFFVVCSNSFLSDRNDSLGSTPQVQICRLQSYLCKLESPWRKPKVLIGQGFMSRDS